MNYLETEFETILDRAAGKGMGYDNLEAEILIIDSVEFTKKIILEFHSWEKRVPTLSRYKPYLGMENILMKTEEELLEEFLKTKAI